MNAARRPAVAVLGSGSWGTALAILLARNGVEVKLWGHLDEEIDKLLEEGENSTFLPGYPFPPGLTATTDLSAATATADEVVVVVPSHAFRTVLTRVEPLLASDTGVSWATKGLDPKSGRLLHEVAAEVLGDRPVAVISGPSFAGEVAAGQPTAVTVASSSRNTPGRSPNCSTQRPSAPIPAVTLSALRWVVPPRM